MDERCYNEGDCCPIVVDCHLARSYLFYGQLFECIIAVLPLEEYGATIMQAISEKQGGLRTASQLDHDYISRHLSKYQIT